MSKARRERRDARQAGLGPHPRPSAAAAFEEAVKQELNPLESLNRAAERIGLQAEAVSPDDPRVATQIAERIAVWAAKIEALMRAEHSWGPCCEAGECQYALIAAMVGVADRWAALGRYDMAQVLLAALDLGDPEHTWWLAAMAGYLARLVPKVRGATKRA